MEPNHIGSFFCENMKKKDIFYYSVPVAMLAQGEKTSDVEVLRVGTIQDRGLEITPAMLRDYVKNFKNGAYGTEIQVNLEHNRGSAAAGWIKNLYEKTVDNVARLFATVEWTELGVENITKSLFKFVSAELASHYPHHEDGHDVKNVFIGLALTNTPALKGQTPIALSEEEKQSLFNTRMLTKYVKSLKSRKVVSKADKTLLAEMLDEATDTEKEEVKADVAEINKKPEEEKKEEVAAEGDEKLSDTSITALKEANKQIAILNQTVNRLNLAKLADSLMVSETNKTGFVGDELHEKALDFLSEIKPAQRDTFLALIKGIQTVELATKGAGSEKTGGNDGDNDEDDLEDFVTKTAAKLIADGKANDAKGKPDMGKAQKMASAMYKEKEGKK